MPIPIDGLLRKSDDTVEEPRPEYYDLAFAFTATTYDLPPQELFCVVGGSAPPGSGPPAPPTHQVTPMSPRCVPMSTTGPVRAAYVSSTRGPLEVDEALYLAGPAPLKLRLFDDTGAAIEGKAVCKAVCQTIGSDELFIAHIRPQTPPVRFRIDSN
jgi:hypothetical protein